MARILPISLSLLTTAAAHAQTPDSLASTAPDSVTRGPRLVTTSGFSTTAVSATPLPPFTTLQPALSRVAGVQVTPYSGAPGAWSTVRIRGVANLTGSRQPLYVVDGVPVYTFEATPEDWTGFYQFINQTQGTTRLTVDVPASLVGNPLLDIPVEDVDQVEVVQGAAATAQYGMQGTNGVIRISTRRGADGAAAAQPVRVRYAGWAGVQQVRQQYELLGARQNAELTNVAAVNNGYAPYYSAAEINGLQEVSWQDKAFRVAGIQSHNLSLDGLTAHHTRYYVAADYLGQAGVLLNSRLSRYSLRANVEQQLGRKLTVGVKVAGSQLDQRQPSLESDAGSALRSLLLAPPFAPDAANTAVTSDPLYRLKQLYHQPRTRRLLSQLHATYQFTPALALRAYGSHERVDMHDNLYRAPMVQPDGSRYDSEETADADVKNWVAGAELLYQRTFQERHAFTGSLQYLRQEFDRKQRQEQTGRQISGSGQPLGGQSEKYIETTLKSKPIHSPTAAIGYVYGGRYEVQASMRSDFVLGNDNTDSEYRWYPGGEVRWHVDKEAFLRAVPGLSALTLSAGAGRTRDFFSSARTDHTDAGLHLGVLRNKLTLDATVYERRTQQPQTIVPVLLPGTTGSGMFYLLPDLTLLNRGLNLTLSGTWQAGSLRGLSTLAAATNHNEVQDLPETNNRSLPYYEGLANGQPLSAYYVIEPDGTYPAGSAQAGQIRFRDRNNDGQQDYNDGRLQGSGLPRYTFNLYQQLSWQKWQLEAQLDGLFGYQIFNATLLALDLPSGYNNNSPRVLDYWTPTNQNTAVPRPGRTAFASFYPLSSANLESGNHVRLSQLVISYEVLNKASRRASVWVGGQNLFVTGKYRGYDPNVSSGGAAPLYAGRDASVYPVARVWQVGVRGQF